ncbi:MULTISPECIES: hypothetical protein [Spirosoma]|uniref:Uncharacterized protein n=1 Tax=Spirosoma sordidisoli TaxID=2502893 RepID=A0A4Q2UP75_9BACT|nr:MULTISPECIES: hypothetical protein [Spirosoma]RYC71244.1 hypothetical protein EQG79_03615 [Spirosoma sordidisoli]
MGKAIIWPSVWLLITAVSIWFGQEGVKKVFYDNTARLGLITNLVSSAVFLPMIFVLLKPKILISSYIMETDKDSRFPNQAVFSFKIINSSIFFKAFDVNLNLWSVTEEVASGKNDIVIQDVPLVRSDLFYIESVIKGCSLVDKNSPCACIFTTTTDIRPLVAQRNQYLQLQVIVRHGLSGLSGVFTKKYYKPSKYIMKGEFKHGLSLSPDI